MSGCLNCGIAITPGQPEDEGFCTPNCSAAFENKNAVLGRKTGKTKMAEASFNDLSKEFDKMLDDMQTPEARESMQRAFSATPEQLGQAAVRGAMGTRVEVPQPPPPIKVGDTITRLLGGKIPMKLRVSEITGDRIICGAWEFDKRTGAEIDEDLGWGPPPKFAYTGSFIKMPGVKYEAMSDEDALALMRDPKKED